MADSNPWMAGAEAVMRSFGEAQKQLVESWAQFAAKGAAQPPFASAANPFGRALSEWQRLMQESLRQVRWDDSFMQGVAERAASSQQSLWQLVQHFIDAYQALLKQPENWQALLEEYREQFYQRLRAPQALSEDISELWVLYLRELQKFGQLWYPPALSLSQLAANGRVSSSEVSRLIDHFWSAFDRTLGRALSSPTIGYNREFNAKLLRGFEAWLELRRAEVIYQAHLAEIFTKAFDALMQQLLERSRRGEAPQSAKELINLWIATADEVFVEEFGKQGYIEAQGALLHATMRYRICERAILESFLEAYGLPTRSELDEAYQTIYQLKRELKALKRDVKALRPPAQPLSAPAAEDDLTRIKGVGPKLAEQLRAAGITSLKQIAELTDDEIAHLDAQIPALRGRITRDDWRAQARALLG